MYVSILKTQKDALYCDDASLLARIADFPMSINDTTRMCEKLMELFGSDYSVSQSSHHHP